MNFFLCEGIFATHGNVIYNAVYFINFLHKKQVNSVVYSSILIILLLKNDFLKYIRNDTFLDETKSAVATITFGTSVIEWFKSNNFFSNKSLAKLSEINRKEEEIENIKNELDVIKETKEKNNNNKINAILDSLEKEKEIDIHKIQSEIEDTFNNLNDKIDDNKEQISKFINSSLVDMDAKMSDYYSNSQILEDNMNSSTQSDAGQKIDLAHKLIENDKLRKLANMMGKLQDVMSSVKNKNWKSRSDEIYSITLGSDIGRTISSELIKLGNDCLKKEFLKIFQPFSMSKARVCLSLMERKRLWQSDKR